MFAADFYFCINSYLSKERTMPFSTEYNMLKGGGKMALINRIDNIASVTYDGETIDSLPAETLLLLAPTITKAVDMPTASIGDILTYDVTITNVGLTEITDLAFSDTIPAGSEYVDGSFKLDGTTVTPVIAGGVLSYTIPTITALGNAVIQFQVEVIGGEI